MGHTRQEIWISDHLGKIEGIMMAPGAALTFMREFYLKTPNWNRLINELKHVWKRYLFANSIFIFLFIKRNLKQE